MHVLWEKCNFVYCVWISSCTSSICWKDYSFSTRLPFLLNQLPVYVWVCFCTLSSVSLICLSNMISVTQCIDHYSVVSLEVRQCMVSNSSFRSCFGYSVSFALPYEIVEFANWFIFLKKACWDLGWYYLGSVGQYGKHCHLELFSSQAPQYSSPNRSSLSQPCFEGFSVRPELLSDLLLCASWFLCWC